MSIEAEYQLDPVAPVFGVSMRGTLSIAPSTLVLLFGAPVCWKAGGETVGGYSFAGPQGSVTTVYITAHDLLLEEIVGMRSEFWVSDESHEFYVSARSGDDADHFAHWLIARADASACHRQASSAKWLSARTILYSFL